MINLNQHQENTIFLWVCQLQSQVYSRLLEKNNIINKSYDQRQILNLGDEWRKILQSIKEFMLWRICSENVQCKKAHKNWNRCIEFNHRSLPQSEMKRQVTFDDISIKEIIFSRTKLQCSWQETTYDNNFLEILKNICERNISTESVYES